MRAPCTGLSRGRPVVLAGKRYAAAAPGLEKGESRNLLLCRLYRQYLDGPTGCCGSTADLREQRLTGSTIHETELPESGYSPLASLAAQRPLTPANFTRDVARVEAGDRFPTFTAAGQHSANTEMTATYSIQTRNDRYPVSAAIAQPTPASASCRGQLWQTPKALQPRGFEPGRSAQAACRASSVPSPALPTSSLSRSSRLSNSRWRTSRAARRSSCSKDLTHTNY